MKIPDTLFLTLKSEYFQQMLDGTKNEEYRLITPFFDKRLLNREYKFVMFQNGYSPVSPRLKRVYNGFYKKRMIYDGIKQEVYALRLGAIVATFHMEHFKSKKKRKTDLIVTSVI